MNGPDQPWDVGSGCGDAETRRRRLRDIQDVARELRQPVQAPDLTAAILARVDEERPFVPEKTRRLIWISRLGFAASIAVAAFGIALLHSAAPDLVNLRPVSQPVSDVMHTAKVEASARYQTIRTTVSSVGSLAAAGGELGLGRRDAVGRMVEGEAVAGADAAGGLIDARLAPLPPAYCATYLALGPGRGRAHLVSAAMSDAEVEPAPVISAVRLTPGLMPRPLADDAHPSMAFWAGGRLSTSPAASVTVPVLLEPGQFGGPALPRVDRAPLRAGVWLDRTGLIDSLSPAGAGADDGATAVPR